MTELPYVWTCPKCGHVIRTGPVRAPVKVNVTVLKCGDPRCDGVPVLSIEGLYWRD